MDEAGETVIAVLVSVEPPLHCVKTYCVPVSPAMMVDDNSIVWVEPDGAVKEWGSSLATPSILADTREREPS